MDAARFTALHREQALTALQLEQAQPADAEVIVTLGAPRLNCSKAWVDARISYLLYSGPPPSPPCSPPGLPESTRPPTPTPPASHIRCEDEGNLVANLAPATLLER